MANTVVQQPKQTPAPAAANAAAHSAGPTSNDQATAAAHVDRRRKSAAAVPNDWKPALGGLLPPEATTTAPHLTIHPPALDQFRHDTYKLAVRAVPGYEAALQYLADADIDKKYQDALRAVGQAATPDRATLTEIRTAVVMVCAGTGGDLGQASIKILGALGRASEDAKQYLRANENAILTPLQTFLGNASNFPNPQAPATKTKRAQFEALWTTLHTATPSPGMATTSTPAAPAGAPVLTAAQAAARTKITTEIATEFPYVAGGKVVPATPAQLTKLRHDIDTADPVVRDAVYAWRDDHGRSALQLLGMHASPEQVHAVNLSLDGVERLVASLDQMYAHGDGGENAHNAALGAKMVHDFLAAHLADQATRDRVRDNAPLMQRYVRNFPDAQRKVIMRMIASGHEQPDAVDKVHEACDTGNAEAAVAAIFELGQTPAKLQALRSDLVFVHRLQDKCNKVVPWHGVQVKPYDLFLQMCGVDPHQTQEAGAAPKQVETDPLSQNKPLTEQENQKLEAEVFNPFAKPLADELNAWLWVNDSTVMGILHKFEAAAAANKDLLRRAHKAPGPELARRVEGYHVECRLKLQRGLSQENLVQAERILGFATDQATVGVIGGAGTLAADTKNAAKGKVPLEQALRETMIGGAVLTDIIHGKAQELADELGRWFGARADHVRAIWQSYNGQVNPKVCAQLRDQTGLPRVWSIELLANAFLQVGGGTLQSRVQQALGRDHNDVITEMGLQATDIASRRTLAETKTVQDNKNEAVNTQQLVAAHDHVDQAAKVDSYRPVAKALFDAFANLRQDASDNDLKHLGAMLTADLKLAPIPAGREIKSAEKPGGPVAAPGTTASAQPATTDFASFYHHEYGVDPRRHAVEVAKSLGQSRSRDAKTIGTLLGVSDPSLYDAPKPIAGELAITEANITLVAPGFTVDEAQRRAKKMWDLLRSNGAIQLIRQQFDGRTPEEQRLIRVAFARLSGGMDLTFYIQQQQATAMRPEDDGVVVAGGASVHMTGSKAESDMLLKVSQNGRITLEDRISGAISADQMDDVYAAIEGASPDERRAILANDALMNKLRKFGDDSYEWNRIYKGLAGDSDLFDRLESHAHGKHGFIGGFEGTDKDGMTRDIAGYAKQRKAAIRVQVLAELSNGAEPTDKVLKDKVDTEVTKRLTAEFQSIAENPSVRAILHDELSGVQLSKREGMLLNGGEENHAASALTESDWTDDKAKIIADIKAMSPAERKALRENPEYLDQLRRDIGTQARWREAMIALGSDVDGSAKDVPDDNYGALEKASRDVSEDTTEMMVENDAVIESLSKLSPDEYARLQKDPRMQQQILYALRNYPAQLAQARQMMSFNASDAAAMTGLTTAKDGDKPDPAHGVYTQEQVTRIAFLKFGAINRLRAGASRTWPLLLQASIAAYELKLRPSDNPVMPTADPSAGAMGATAAQPALAPDVAKPGQQQRAAGTPAHGAPIGPTAAAGGAHDAGPPIDPTAGEAAIEQRLRSEILAAVQDDISHSIAGWGEQDGADDKTHLRRKLSTSEQQSMITAAIMHRSDPSDSLLLKSTNWLHDDNDRIKDTIKKASEEQLIHEWTTVVHHAPNGNPSLAEKYNAWKATRPADAKPEDKRTPRVGSPEWNARTAFKAFVIDTSDTFEDLLIKYTGGLNADDGKLAPGDDRIRQNNEWLEWRTLVRDRIPSIDRKKIAESIGAGGDAEAISILTDPTLSNTLGALAYDEERYQVDRGEHSNYNMDRITAGGSGLTEDNAFGDYKREVLTSVTSEGTNAGEDYGKITAEESARIATAKDRFSKSTTDFRAAKAAVANVATTVVMLVITAVVTILTAGLATGPLAAVLFATATAAASSAGSQLTRKAIQGSDFELGHEGLQNLARDTVLGAVTLGSTQMANKIASSIIDVTAATEQAAIIAGIARNPTFLQELGKSAIEQGAQVSLQGVFETGQAAFDPALWMDGWKEGWIRGSANARDRAATIPEEGMKAALLIAFAKLGKQGSHSVLGKITGAAENEEKVAVATEAETENQELTAEQQAEKKAEEEAKKQAAPGGKNDHDAAHHAAFGTRESLAERTKTMGKAMTGSIEDGVWMGVGQELASEKTWDGESTMADFVGGVGSNVISMLLLASNSVYTNDAIAAHRYRTGAQELTKNGKGLTENEKHVYAELVIHGTDETAITVRRYVDLRQKRMDRAVADYNSKVSGDPEGQSKPLTTEQKEHFEHWIKDSTSLEDFEARLLQGPEVTVANGPMAVSQSKSRGDNPIMREHTLHEAQAAAKLLDAKKATFTPTVDLVAPANRLRSMCELRAKEIPVDCVQGKQVASLLAKVEQVNAELESDLMYCTTLSSGAEEVRLLLHRRIAEARANRGDPAKAQAAFNELRTLLAYADFKEDSANFHAADQSAQRHLAELQGLSRQIDALGKQRPITTPGSTTSTTATPVDAVVPVKSTVTPSQSPTTPEPERVQLQRMIGTVGTPEAVTKLDQTETKTPPPAVSVTAPIESTTVKPVTAPPPDVDVGARHIDIARAQQPKAAKGPAPDPLSRNDLSPFAETGTTGEITGNKVHVAEIKNGTGLENEDNARVAAQSAERESRRLHELLPEKYQDIVPDLAAESVTRDGVEHWGVALYAGDYQRMAAGETYAELKAKKTAAEDAGNWDESWRLTLILENSHAEFRSFDGYISSLRRVERMRGEWNESDMVLATGLPIEVIRNVMKNGAPKADVDLEDLRFDPKTGKLVSAPTIIKPEVTRAKVDPAARHIDAAAGEHVADESTATVAHATSLDGKSVTTDLAHASPEAREVISSLEKKGFVTISSISPDALVEVSKWFGKEIAVVQAPYGQLRVVLGETDQVLSSQLRPGEQYLVHTHPVFVSRPEHFASDVAAASKGLGVEVEAVVDWSGQLTYFDKSGLRNSTNARGELEPLHNFAAGFMGKDGAIVGYARIDVAPTEGGATITVRPQNAGASSIGGSAPHEQTDHEGTKIEPAGAVVDPMSRHINGADPTRTTNSNGMVARLKAGEAVPVPKNGTAYETMKEIARATGQDVVLVRLADGNVRMMMGVEHEADLPDGTQLVAKVSKNGQATTYGEPGTSKPGGVPATPARMAELLRKRTAEEKRDKALKPDITGPLATPEGKAIGESLPPPPPGMIRLVDGTLAKGDGTPIDPETRAWLDARKAERAEFSGAPRKIVIDGGGPTGALTALQAFMLGSTVTLVESREEATLPILWTNRPGVMEVLMLIDPVLAKRMQAVSGEVKFYDHVSPDGHNDHHAIDAKSRQLDPARATGDPRKIAGESSTWTSQNKTEVELIWQRLGELADKEAASAKRAGRPPRLVLKRGYDVVELPVDGNKRGVIIQQSENRLFKVDANKQNVLGEDGQPITMDYKTGDKIPPGWEKKKVQHEREDLGTPDDVFTADGAGSKGRGMAGGKSVDVGPSARFIAGYFHGVGLEGTDKDGNTVQGGAKTNSEIGTDGRELHAVASSGSHLDASTWGLPEVDPNLDFKSPESIEKYFGKPMSEQDAVLLYYKTQMAKMNNRPLSDFDNITFDQLPNGMGPGGRGPSPFTLQSHVTGDMADDATNVHALGDSGGNSHFFASLGKGTGTGTHQMAYRQYEQALEWGMDPEIAAAILQRRLDAGTRVWLKSGLPGFTDRSKPLPEPTTDPTTDPTTAPVTDTRDQAQHESADKVETKAPPAAELDGVPDQAHRPPPTPEQAEENRTRAREVIAEDQQRSAQLAALVAANPAPYIEHIIIGNGPAAAMSASTDKAATGAPPGPLTALPKTISISNQTDWWQERGDREAGQPVDQWSSPGFRVQPGDFNPDHAGRGRGSDVAYATALTAHASGLVNLMGEAHRIEARPDHADWPTNAKWRVQVGTDDLGKWLYTDSITYAGGKGGARDSAAIDPIKDQLIASGRLAYAQTTKLPEHVGPVDASNGTAGTLAVIGGSATAAWTALDAAQRGQHVMVIARHGFAEGLPDALRQKLAAAHVEMIQADVLAAADNGKQVALTLSGDGDKGRTVFADSLSLAMGQSGTFPIGTTLQHYRPVWRTYAGKPRVVALEAYDALTGKPTGLMIQGAAMSAAEFTEDNRIQVDDRPAFRAALKAQISDDSVPAESRNVPGNIYQMGIDVPLANQPEQTKAADAQTDAPEHAGIIPLVAPGTQGRALSQISLEERSAAQDKYASVIALLEAGEHVPMPTGSASVEMMAGITIATGKEVALLRAPHEVRYLMLGDAPVGLPADVKVIAHTHPSGTLLLSPDDQAAIRATDQLSTVVISPDGLAGRLRIDPQAGQLDQAGSRQINDVKETVGDGPTPDRKKQLGLSDKTVELGGQQRPASRIMEILGSRMAPLKLVNTPGKVMWVDMDLARELGFKVPAGNVMTQALHDEIIATLSYRVLPEGADPQGATVVDGAADKYNGSGMGYATGAGRAAFLPGLNANIKGSGRTPLAAPAKSQQDYTHNHGGAPAREGLLEASWGLVSDNLFANKGTRILAVIDTGDNTPWADGTAEPRALIIRAGNQLRPAHVNFAGDSSANSADMFAAMAKDSGFLVMKGNQPDFRETMLNAVDRQAQLSAEQYRFRILHGAVSTSNLEWDGGMIDHGTTTSVSRTEPAKILEFMKSHFGTEDEDRAKELATVYEMIRTTAKGSRPGSINFQEEMEKRFEQHMSVEMLDATGLKHDVAENLAAKQPKLAAELRDSLEQLGGLSEHAGSVNIDKTAAPTWSTVDIFNMLGELPEHYFAAPDADLRPTILALLKVQGTIPHELSGLIDKFADRYKKAMKAAQQMSTTSYDGPAEMQKSIISRAKFENQPINLLARADVGQKFNDAITDFRNRSKTMSVDDPELTRPIREAVDKQVANSIRSVEGLLKQGSPKKLPGGGLETEQRTIDGINYSVRAWPDGKRRLHMSIPIAGNDETGYTFPTLHVNAVGGTPHLYRDQIDAMSFRFSVDGWKTPQEVNAKMDEAGQVTFDMPALASDVGRLEGAFHSQSRGDFWWKDGQSDFRGYNFAIPDNQEFGHMEEAAEATGAAMAPGSGGAPAAAPVPGGQPTDADKPAAQKI